MDRRRFLSLPAGLALTACWPFAAGLARSKEIMLASGFASTTKLFGAATLSPAGEEWPLWMNPVRLHQILQRPGSSQLLAIARRPGRIFAVLEIDEGREPPIVEAAAGRHFSGHGVFSGDGRYLFTTENDYEMGKGVIGVRDADRGYRQINEWSSYGMGPHDVLLSADRRRLFVANGGIRTHPDTGRTKLNLESMQPSLTMIDAANGKLEQRIKLPAELHQLSIRHLAATADGRIVFAMQDKATPRPVRPLVGLLGSNGSLRLLDAPADALAGLHGYIGSVVVDRGSRYAAVSSPRGGRLVLWNLRSLDYAGQVELPDVCGIAPAEEAGEFVVTSGFGDLARLRMTEAGPRLLNRTTTRYRWDNHLTVITGT